MKDEIEVGLGAFGLLGGDTTGVSLVLLSPDTVWNYCLGKSGRERVCLLHVGMCVVANHEKQKLDIR
jgi:hypothetical protein